MQKGTEKVLPSRWTSTVKSKSDQVPDLFFRARKERQKKKRRDGFAHMIAIKGILSDQARYWMADFMYSPRRCLQICTVTQLDVNKVSICSLAVSVSQAVILLRWLAGRRRKWCRFIDKTFLHQHQRTLCRRTNPQLLERGTFRGFLACLRVEIVNTKSVLFSNNSHSSSALDISRGRRKGGYECQPRTRGIESIG